MNIGLFEMSDSSDVTMAMKLQLLNKLLFIHKILAHAKDEGSNL